MTVVVSSQSSRVYYALPSEGLCLFGWKLLGEVLEEPPAQEASLVAASGHPLGHFQSMGDSLGTCSRQLGEIALMTQQEQSVFGPICEHQRILLHQMAAFFYILESMARHISLNRLAVVEQT